MKIRESIKKIKKLFIICTLIIFLAGCASTNSTTILYSDSGESRFIPFDLEEFNIESFDVVNYQLEEILNSFEVRNYVVEKIEVVTLNESLIQLVNDYYVSYYGEDIDWRKLGVDLAIGTVAIISWVALAAATGGTSAIASIVVTVLGNVGLSVTSAGVVAFTQAALVGAAIGISIDASIEAISAAKDGGDLNYILGRSLNGVVDGLKWAVIFAPVSNFVGQQLIRGFRGLKSLIALNTVIKKSSNLFKHLNSISDPVFKKNKKIINNFILYIRSKYGIDSYELFSLMNKDKTDDLAIKYLQSLNIGASASERSTNIRQIIALSKGRLLPTQNNTFKAFYDNAISTTGDSGEWYTYFKLLGEGEKTFKELATYPKLGEKMNIFGLEEVTTKTSRISDIVIESQNGINRHIEVKVGVVEGAEGAFNLRQELYGDFLRLINDPLSFQEYRIFTSESSGKKILDNPQFAKYLLKMKEEFRDRVTILFNDIEIPADQLVNYA